MNPVRHLRRLAAALAGVAGTLLAFTAAAPAALARPLPPRPPGWNKHPPPLSHGYLHYVAPHGAIRVPGRTVVIGGMPGWQIALIAIGAALLAATGAVLASRAWAALRRPVPVAAGLQPGGVIAVPNPVRSSGDPRVTEPGRSWRA